MRMLKENMSYTRISLPAAIKIILNDMKNFYIFKIQIRICDLIQIL